ncbi:MAG: diguanylate cyclase [Armatimonadetes bacterium]|nr:diguanylate cyclase [Armatimonadota bacterium]
MDTGRDSRALLFILAVVLLCPGILSPINPVSAATEADRLYQQGQAYQKRGQVDSALPFYLKAVEEDSKHLPSLFSLCHLFISKGDSANAYAFCEAAISLDPKNAALHNNLGILYTMRNEQDRAIESFETSIRLSPKFRAPRENVALLYSKVGMIGAAIDQYEQLILLIPDELSYKISLAKLYRGNNDRKSALKILRQAVELSPNHLEANLFLADVLTDSNEGLKEAMQIYDHVLHLDPSQPDALLGKGKILLRQGRPREAQDQLRQLLSAYPDHLEVRNLLLQAEQQITKQRTDLMLLLLGILSLLAAIYGGFLLRARRRRLAAEAELVKAFGAQLKEIHDPRTGAGVILDFFSEFLECPYGIACLTEYARKRLIPQIQNLAFPIDGDFPFAQEEIRRLLTSRGSRPFTLEQLSRESLYRKAFPGIFERFENLPVQWFIPLVESEGRDSGKMLGFLALGTSVARKAQEIARAVKKKKLSILMKLINLAARTLEDLNLYMLAVQDDLTRLFNKRAFLDRLTDELKNADKTRLPCSLLMLDIDHFKQLNDTYGHLQGDIVLRDVAEQVKLSLREGDVVARYGGEEFAVILPQTGSTEALGMAEKIRENIAALQSDEIPRQVTVSIGAAAYPIHARTDVRLIKLADVSLYYSKRNGRNRATLISDIPDGEKDLCEEASGKAKIADQTTRRLVPPLKQAAERIQREMDRAIRENYPISFVAIAPSGDLALDPQGMTQAVRIIREHMRLIDFLLQYDEKRLILVSPKSAPDDVESSMQLLITSLREAVTEASQDGCSFGAGIAVFPQFSSDQDAVLEGCLRALETALSTRKAVVLQNSRTLQSSE